MARNRLSLGDRKLSELYARFQRQRRSLGELYPHVDYEDFVDHGRYQGAALPAVAMAREHIIAITNTLNRFWYDLRNITVWGYVFDSLSEDEKLLALYEFLYSIMNQCLSAPYSIKQMFIKSVCHVCHQTNRFLDANWSESFLKSDRDLSFKDAINLAKNFRSWSKLCHALSHLNHANFLQTTDDYRNRFNHGFPPRIELGWTMTVRRDQDSHKYVIANPPPFLIADLVPPLSEQYEAALNSYNAYVELLKEEQATWFKATQGERDG